MKLWKQFGKSPTKKRKQQYAQLSHYRNGSFQNLIDTPALVEGVSIVQVLLNFFKKHPGTIPKSPLPTVQTDIKSIPIEEDVLIWFGHSSYYLQLDGKRILVDPVFSGNVSPLRNMLPSFLGTNTYQVDDFPDLDILMITHDHWDHLDYETVERLKGRVGTVVCGLGVGQHFEYWGWDPAQIKEGDWYDEWRVAHMFRIIWTPARHFSGRLFKRNTTLWTSYVLETSHYKLFLGGDGGYAPHFKEIGNRFGPFDVAILECGQYNENWPYIHSQPHEVLVEIRDLKAQYLMPVHHSKFKLANHPWEEPLKLVTAVAQDFGTPIVIPKIGAVVFLKHMDQEWEKWWK